MLRSLVLSLALTLLLELSCGAFFGIRSRQELFGVALINIVTNPLVVLVLNLFLYVTGAPAPWYWVACLEVAVFLSEGFLLSRCLAAPKFHPFVLSLIFNIVSYLGGLLLS